MANNNSDNTLDKMLLPSSTAWIASTFEYYTIPSDIGKDVMDPSDDHIQHRCQSHYLGPAFIKSGDHPAIQVDFYKVTRSEISKLVYDKKQSKRWSSFDGAALSSPEGTDNCHFLSDTFIAGTTLPLILPPKKRKKRRVTQQCVIFSFKKHHGAHDPLTPGDTYYLFPKNSMMTAINDVITIQMHLTCERPSALGSTVKYRTKLEELAAICISTELLGPHDISVDPSFSDTGSSYIQISGASVDLYYSLKEIVTDHKVPGQEKVRMKSSTVSNWIANNKKGGITGNGSAMTAKNEHNKNTSLDSNKRNYTTINAGDKNHPPTLKKKTKRTSITNHVKDSNGTKQCAYCSTTSTPMWRRGPEGAGTLCNACGVKWKHGKILTGNDKQNHLGKTTGKRKKPTTWACKKDNRTTLIEGSTTSVDLQLHEHIYYAQQTHERNSEDLTVPSSPSSSSNESVGHSPFTSFTSSPASIDSHQHPVAFIADKFGLNDTDLTLTSAAADVEAAAVLTLLSQSFSLSQS